MKNEIIHSVIFTRFSSVHMCTKNINFHIEHVWLDAKEIHEELNRIEKKERRQEETRNENMYNCMEDKNEASYELQSPNVRFHRTYFSRVDGVTLGRIFRKPWTKSCREIGRIRLTDKCFNSSTRSSRTGPIAASFANAVKSLPE